MSFTARKDPPPSHLRQLQGVACIWKGILGFPRVLFGSFASCMEPWRTVRVTNCHALTCENKTPSRVNGRASLESSSQVAWRLNVPYRPFGVVARLTKTYSKIRTLVRTTIPTQSSQSTQFYLPLFLGIAGAASLSGLSQRERAYETQNKLSSFRTKLPGEFRTRVSLGFKNTLPPAEMHHSKTRETLRTSKVAVPIISLGSGLQLSGKSSG